MGRNTSEYEFWVSHFSNLLSLLVNFVDVNKSLVRLWECSSSFLGSAEDISKGSSIHNVYFALEYYIISEWKLLHNLCFVHLELKKKILWDVEHAICHCLLVITGSCCPHFPDFVQFKAFWRGMGIIYKRFIKMFIFF